jgi:hypothetical protein
MWGGAQGSPDASPAVARNPVFDPSLPEGPGYLVCGCETTLCAIDSQHDAPLSRSLIAETRMAIWICAAHARSECVFKRRQQASLGA